MESQPQNPEFCINPENYHPCWQPDQSLHCVLSGEAKDSCFLCADREDSDQIELITVFL